MATPTVADPGDHVYARILTYRGVITTGNPWDVTGGGVKAAASTTVTVTGVTTTVPDTLIVQAVARDDDSSAAAFSAQTNANLTSITERSDAGTTSGNGGGFAVWTGVKAAAGATGDTTATVTSSINAFLTIALKPELLNNFLVEAAGGGSIGTQTAGTPFSIRITARDASNSTMTGFTGTVNITSTGVLSAGGGTTAAFTAGVLASHSVTISNTGSITITATNTVGPQAGTSNAFTVNAGAFVKLQLLVPGETAAPGTGSGKTGTPCVQAAGTAFTVTVNAVDANWNPVNTVTDTVGITSSDASAMLPGNAALVAGTRTFSVTLNTAGTWTVTATDITNGAKTPNTSPSITVNVAPLVQVDATSSGSGTGTTIDVTHTVSGTDRLMLVGISAEGAVSTLTVNSVVWDPGGASQLTLTQVGTQLESGNVVRMWIFQGVGPATGTKTLRVTFNNAGDNKVVGVMSFTGVNQSTPLGTFASAEGRSGNPAGAPTVASVNVTSAAGELVFDTVAGENSITVGCGQTQRWNLAFGNVTGGGSTRAGDASVTMSWSIPIDDRWAIGAVSIKPGAGAPVAGGFNAYETSTAAGAITGVIKTKIAGSTVSLDMIALNAAKTAIETTFTGTVRVEVLNASDNSGALDGNNCRPTWTVIQTLSPDPAFIAGDLGRKTISFTQANSYPNARLRITFPAGAPAVTGCSTDNFAIRPNTFASFAVTDTDWQTAGLGRALTEVTFGTVTHKAGRPLSARATALNAAGTPAVTTNYTGAPTATLTACGSAACTATFGTLTLTTTFVAGQLSSDVASYDNVGSFSLQLVDSAFASVDAADGSTTTERNITSAVINVGRFVPDHFAVALNTPTFGTACGAGGFTYMGQTFNYTVQPAITVTAQNFTNGTTTLYAGAWLRITNASVTPATQAARYSRFDALGAGTTPALDPAGLPATAGDPAIGVFTNGVGALTFASGTGLGFVRSTTTPNAPFNADIALALNVIDTDGVVFASNPATFGAATAGNGIAFSSGKPMRFGRLAIRNANGSQLVPLPVQLEAQYWNFTNPPTNTVLGFITHTADSCTTLATNNEAMSNFTNNLAACETAITAVNAFSSGRSRLTLAAPGSANNGSVDLTVNLSAATSGTTCTTVGGATVPAAGANRTYLQGNWTGGLYNVNPTARATFGVFKGAEEVIFIRENF